MFQVLKPSGAPPPPRDVLFRRHLSKMDVGGRGGAPIGFYDFRIYDLGFMIYDVGGGQKDYPKRDRVEIRRIFW